MERNAGVTARAGPGWDFGNAEVVVSQTLPLLALQERSHPHSLRFGIDGSQDSHQSVSDKSPSAKQPPDPGVAEHIRTWIPYSCCLPKKTPPKQIHQRMKAQRIKLGVFSPKLNWALPRQPRVVPSLGKDTGKVLGDTAATSVSPPGDPSPHPAPQLQARHSFALRIPWIFLLLTGLKW